jgi:hypothetical protein
MRIRVIGLTSIYTERSCLVTVELVETTGVISKVTEKLEIAIPKPYDHIGKAVEWEIATLLNQNGYNVFVPEKPFDVLPEEQPPMEMTEPVEVSDDTEPT